eukprot:3581829-Pyramimonas_sp.AAC.1
MLAGAVRDALGPQLLANLPGRFVGGGEERGDGAAGAPSAPDKLESSGESERAGSSDFRSATGAQVKAASGGVLE